MSTPESINWRLPAFLHARSSTRESVVQGIHRPGRARWRLGSILIDLLVVIAIIVTTGPGEQGGDEGSP